MKYEEAVQRVLHASEENSGLIVELRNGKTPSIGDVETVLKALKSIFNTLKDEKKIDRALASALYGLAFYSNEYANLLSTETPQAIEFKEAIRFDLQFAVESIFLGDWIEQTD